MKSMFKKVSVMVIAGLMVIGFATWFSGPNVSASSNSDGEQKVIFLKTSNADVIGGELSYDKNVYDLVNIQSCEGWEDVTFNPENGKFITKRNSGQSAETVEVTLLVKYDVYSPVSLDLEVSDGKVEKNRTISID